MDWLTEWGNAIWFGLAVAYPLVSRAIERRVAERRARVERVRNRLLGVRVDVELRGDARRDALWREGIEKMKREAGARYGRGAM